jgi:hypothetical protein
MNRRTFERRWRLPVGPERQHLPPLCLTPLQINGPDRASAVIANRVPAKQQHATTHDPTSAKT